NIVPALAESWEIADNGKDYTFHLRDDITFHNGETFEAEDVVTTWEAGKDPLNAYAYIFEEVENIEIIDDYTVVVTTKEIDALFMTTGFVSSLYGMYPSDYYNEVGFEGFEEHPIGAGPFKFVEWVKGERIVLEAFEDYYEPGLPKLDRIIFRPIPESATRLAAVQTGEVHIAPRFVAEEVGQLDGHPDVDVITYSNDRSYYIAFNN
ncbi:MAG: ABC transporter substrate-binding protein, partial [Gammaproteobacteria bacterium]|nr:ABC transporter substrate-binding protein [Gammaproteobacteria bacterium]